MKTNEVPEKIYFSSTENGTHYYTEGMPFEGNEHLLGKTDDCQDFYKIWE